MRSLFFLILFKRARERSIFVFCLDRIELTITNCWIIFTFWWWQHIKCIQRHSLGLFNRFFFLLFISTQPTNKQTVILLHWWQSLYLAFIRNRCGMMNTFKFSWIKRIFFFIGFLFLRNLFLFFVCRFFVSVRNLEKSRQYFILFYFI